MRLKFISLIPAIAWFFLIFFLLILPGSDIPKVGFLEVIYFDKWVHTGLFAVLVFLFCWPFRKTIPNPHSSYIMIMLSAIIYGIIMEYVQKYFTADRTFDITDMMADAFGSIVGYLFFKLVNRKSLEKNKPL